MGNMDCLGQCQPPGYNLCRLRENVRTRKAYSHPEVRSGGYPAIVHRPRIDGDPKLYMQRQQRQARLQLFVLHEQISHVRCEDQTGCSSLPGRPPTIPSPSPESAGKA